MPCLLGCRTIRMTRNLKFGASFTQLLICSKMTQANGGAIGRRGHYEDSDHTRLYRQARPGHSRQLVEKIASVVDQNEVSRNLAVDVGCGSGQFSLLLAEHFKQVVGTDVSQNMIVEAKAEAERQNIKNITFKASPAESLPLPDASVDLLTVSNAVHWFDLEPFYKEVDRVLVPGGIAAFFVFSWPDSEAEGFPNFQQIRRGKFWDKVKDHVDLKILLAFNGYRDIKAPYINHFRLNKGDFTTTERYNVAKYGDMLRTLSTFKIFEKSEGKDKGDEIIRNFAQCAARDMDPQQVPNPERIEFNLVNHYHGIISIKPK